VLVVPLVPLVPLVLLVLLVPLGPLVLRLLLTPLVLQVHCGDAGRSRRGGGDDAGEHVSCYTATCHAHSAPQADLSSQAHIGAMHFEREKWEKALGSYQGALKLQPSGEHSATWIHQVSTSTNFRGVVLQHALPRVTLPHSSAPRTD